MRDNVPPKLEAGRVRTGRYRTTPADGLVGMFRLPCAYTGRLLLIMASTGEDWSAAGLPGEPWEHVSVSIVGRQSHCPSWPEMEFVRELFWNDEETVVQFSPPRSSKVNFHQGCLHLWKPPYPVALPPSITVGPPED